MNSIGEETINDLRMRPASSRRNLAGLREIGINAAPLIFPEGVEDQTLIEKAFADELDVRLVSGGKPACLQLAAWLEEDGCKRSRVLVDRDFDDVVGLTERTNSLLIVTSAHDVLMDVLLSSPRVISATIKSVNKRTFCGLSREEKEARVEVIHAQATSAAFNLSSVRIWSARNSLGLKFDSYSFTNYFRENELTLDATVASVLRKSRGLPGIVIDTESRSVTKGSQTLDAVSGASGIWDELNDQISYLVGDHDFLDALSYLLDDNWGTKKLRTLIESEAERREIRMSPWGERVRRFVEGVSEES